MTVIDLRPQKKNASTPLWSLISGRSRPRRVPATPIVAPMPASKQSLDDEVDAAIAAGDSYAFKWLNAAWMPQDAVKKLDANKKALEAGLDLKPTFRGYTRTTL